MPYLHKLASKDQFTQRQKQKRAGALYWDETTDETQDEDLLENPLYGFRVKSITSSSPLTQCFVVKNHIF